MFDFKKTKKQITAEMSVFVDSIAARRKIDLPAEIRNQIVHYLLVEMLSGYAASRLERKASKLMTTYKLVAGV